MMMMIYIQRQIDILGFLHAQFSTGKIYLRMTRCLTANYKCFFIPMIHSYPQAFHRNYFLGEKVNHYKSQFFGNIGMCFLSHSFGQSLNDNSVLYGLKGNGQFSIKIFQYSTVCAVLFFWKERQRGESFPSQIKIVAFYFIFAQKFFSVGELILFAFQAQIGKYGNA